MSPSIFDIVAELEAKGSVLLPSVLALPHGGLVVLAGDHVRVFTAQEVEAIRQQLSASPSAPLESPPSPAAERGADCAQRLSEFVAWRLAVNGVRNTEPNRPEN
jgi:hypothetical protein